MAITPAETVRMTSMKPLSEIFQWSPFDEYHVRMVIPELVGGVPKHKDLLKGWINATNKEKSDEDRQKLIEASITELPDLSSEKEDKSWVGFKQDDKGLYIEGRQVKAMLKESANIVKKEVPVPKNIEKSGKGIAALKSKVADHVFVVEDKIYLGREKPDLQEERPIHVMTAQGPRTSVKRSDIVKDVTIDFTVRRFCDTAVPEVSLFAILDYCRNLGLGADRSQGKGKVAEIFIEKMPKPEAK